MNAQEYSYVKREVLKLTGVDLNNYKAPQVQRRLKTFLLRSGYDSWTRFFRALRDDQVAIGELNDYLTINVSAFFRDPEKFECLRDSILPELLRGRTTLRVWSAGCSHGHEPYSLAILLCEATGLYRRHQILATDIDHSALDRAKAGGPYSTDEVANVPSDLLSRYFKKVSEDSYQVIDVMRRKITFRYHNILSDPFESRFDLIVCRNVVIYFRAEAKDQLYRRFYDALSPGGVLFLGGTEFLSKASEIGFTSAGFSFYRRDGGAPQPRIKKAEAAPMPPDAAGLNRGHGKPLRYRG
jgi:chemotaxis protein methyltransferase CheR